MPALPEGQPRRVAPTGKQIVGQAWLPSNLPDKIVSKNPIKERLLHCVRNDMHWGRNDRKGMVAPAACLTKSYRAILSKIDHFATLVNNQERKGHYCAEKASIHPTYQLG